ncbi:hypothetical protein QTP88_025331 [Uroleucon formosanum]
MDVIDTPLVQIEKEVSLLITVSGIKVCSPDGKIRNNRPGDNRSNICGHRRRRTTVGSGGGGRGILLYIIYNGLSGSSSPSSSSFSLLLSTDDRRQTQCVAHEVG